MLNKNPLGVLLESYICESIRYNKTTSISATTTTAATSIAEQQHQQLNNNINKTGATTTATTIANHHDLEMKEYMFSLKSKKLLFQDNTHHFVTLGKRKS